MRRALVNTFLVVNFLGAVLAVIFSSLNWLNPDEAQGKALTTLFGLFELALTLPFFYIVISNRKIPSRTYLPLFALYLLPIFLFVDSIESMPFFISILALALSTYAALVRRRFTGDKFGLFPKDFLQKENNQRSRAHWATFALILCLSMNFFGALSLELSKSVQEGLFSGVTFRSDGMYTKVLNYEKDGKRAVVLGMMHVGDESFYKSILSEVPTADTLVLTEGLTDRENKLGDHDPADFATNLLNKSKQGDRFEPMLEADRKTIDADLNVSDISEAAAQYYIDATHETSFSEELSKSKEEREATKKARAQFMLERNQNLIKIFDATESKYQTVVFTWGAAHQEYISDALIQRGYTLVKEKELKAFSYFGQDQ